MLGECRKAHAHIEASPAKRKTARGMPSFLVSWLNRAVDYRAQRLEAKPNATGRTGAAPPGKYAHLDGGNTEVRRNVG